MEPGLKMLEGRECSQSGKTGPAGGKGTTSQRQKKGGRMKVVGGGKTSGRKAREKSPQQVGNLLE